MVSLLKKLVPIVLLLCWTANSFAYEEPVNDLYYFNYYLANPALAGANDCTYAMLGASFNWTGMDKAPMTQMLSVQSRLPRGVGLGGYIFNDRNGYVYQQGLQLSVAYHINMSKGLRYTLNKVEAERQLSFAISGKLFNRGYSSDFHPEANDPAYFDIADFFAFNANVGTYFVSYGFFTGLSVYNLLPMRMWASSVNNIEPYMPVTFQFLIGNAFSFDYEQTNSIEPSLMCKADLNGAIDFDINLKYTRQFVDAPNSAWWLQLAYRSSLETANPNNAGPFQRLYPELFQNSKIERYQPKKLYVMTGFVLNKFHIGYSFGLDLNELMYHNFGSHQIMLGYTFCHVKRFCR